MRQGSRQLVDVLGASFERRMFVNVFHGSDRVASGLAFTGWSLDGDLGAEVGYSGSGTITVPSVNGESWSPVGTEGVLSPFRATLELVLQVNAGSVFSERVSLGMVRIDKVTSTEDVYTTVDGIRRVTASTVGVTFLSVDEGLRRRGFRFPEMSPKGASVWGEIRRLSGMPVEQTVTDVTLLTDQTWEASEGSRLKALHALGKQLGGTLIMNSRGALSVVPDTVGAPVGQLRLGELGTVTDVGSVIDTDGVFNVVVGSFTDLNRAPFYRVATVTDGPLAVDGLYGEHVRYYANEDVTTPAQAEAAVQAVLAESVGSQSYDVHVQCHINPLVEIGDVWELQGWVRPLVGRVVKVSLSDSELMTLVMRAERVLS